MGRSLRPGDRGTHGLRGGPTQKGPPTAEADAARDIRSPGAGRETRDPPRALGPCRKTEGPAPEPWGHEERLKEPFLEPWELEEARRTLCGALETEASGRTLQEAQELEETGRTPTGALGPCRGRTHPPYRLRRQGSPPHIYVSDICPPD